VVHCYRMVNTDTNENSNVYEVGYLLAPTLPEDEVADTESALHEQITAAGGSIVAHETPEMRELSYEIEIKDESGTQAFDHGQFGWVQFSLNSVDLDDVESAFIKDDEVIRHLLVTVDPENAGKQPEVAVETEE